MSHREGGRPEYRYPLSARNGATVILDGGEGIVILDPTPATLDAYRRRQEDFTRERRNLGRLR